MKVEDDNKKMFYSNEKDYMNSYHWNYMVLELVDFIEIKIKEAKSTTGQAESTNKWRYFMEFCHERGLNRRVIRKMIEFSVGQAFESEADLINHHRFKSLKMDDNKVVSAATSTDLKTTITPSNAPIPMAEAKFDFNDLNEMIF